jgi:nucleoside-diphosphate kinase
VPPPVPSRAQEVFVERTFIMVKPNGVARGLVGEVIARFERRGFTLCAMKAMRISRDLAERHYAEHAGKPFFEPLVAFITSGPVVAMVWQGRETISVARLMIGATDSAQAAPGTIRGDFSLSKEENVVHGSDGPESAAREIALFFADEELV